VVGRLYITVLVVFVVVGIVLTITDVDFFKKNSNINTINTKVITCFDSMFYILN
jgi:cell division protein FtsL